MFDIRPLAVGLAFTLAASGVQAATVNATIGGPDTFEVGEFFAVIADIEVTPSSDPVLVFGIPQFLSWDQVVLTASFDGGNGYMENVTMTDTSAPSPNITTADLFDLNPISFFPDFIPDYTAPGIYTQTLSGTVRFFEEQSVTFTELVCNRVYSSFGSYCIGYTEVVRTELRDVEVDSATFSVSRDITVVSTIAPVPLPASSLLLLAGLGGFAAMRRRRG